MSAAPQPELAEPLDDQQAQPEDQQAQPEDQQPNLPLETEWTWYCDGAPQKGLTAKRFATRHMTEIGTFKDVKVC